MEESEISLMENSRKYLSRCLVFPKQEEYSNPGIFFYGKLIALSLSSVVVPMGCLLHLVVNIRRKTYINVDLDLTLVISSIGCYYFTFCYVNQVTNLIKLYKQLSDFSSFGTPTNFEEVNRRLNFFSKCHYIYLTVVVLGISTSPLLEYKKCMQENVEKNLNEICGVLGGLWLPLDVDIFPYKQMYFLYQVYSAFVIYMPASVISFSIVETIEHLITRMRHVSNVFVEALNEKDYSARRRKFNNAVRYHVAVISMAKLLSSCFSSCLFVHVLLTGVILGCIGHTTLESYSIAAISLLVGWMFATVEVGISGQRLMNESVNIGHSVYNSTSNDLDKHIRKELVMVILRCQKPIYLRAGPFGYMTHEMVLTILKTSYTYLTLLSSTT